MMEVTESKSQSDNKAPVLELEHRKEIFRKLAGTAIENSHASIKQVWVALFAGGTFALIKSFDSMMGCAGFFGEAPAGCPLSFDGRKPSDAWGADQWRDFFQLVLLYLIYMLTFYRFYVGNIRVFDMRYIEVGKFVALISEKFDSAGKDKARPKQQDICRAKDELYREFFKYNSEQNRFGDSIFLIFKTLTIISLTLEINNPKIFMSIYLVLLTVDLCWMGLGKFFRTLDRAITNRKDDPVGALFLKQFFERLGLDCLIEEQASPASLRRKLEVIFPAKAVITWSRNNMYCAALLLAVLVVLYRPNWVGVGFVPEWSLYWCGIFVMSLNCIVDLVSTWGFYNPSFREAHDLLALKGPTHE